MRHESNISTSGPAGCLFDLAEMVEAHPKSFRQPAGLDRLKAGDLIQVSAVAGERFWLRAKTIQGDKVRGAIQSHTQRKPDLFGVEIEVGKSNIYAIAAL